jgi:sugar phosphate permease
VLWLTYGAFYFCRTNIAVAVPDLESHLGYSRTKIGLILGAFKLAYALGQLVNGQLAERFSARKLLAIGMLGSALLNLLFGFATGLYFLIFIWACNGYLQALGWSPCMRVAANWIPFLRRGRKIGLLGTSYQLGASLTYVVAGLAAEWLGWRSAFYLPALVLAGAALHMFLFLRETPEPGERIPQVASGTEVASRTGRVLENFLLTLSNPALWLLALALALLDACRYGFVDWGPAHLKDVQQSSIGKAALQYAILPLGGIPGAFLAGWATDRFFGGRRAPVICGLLVLLAALTLAYNWVSRVSPAGTVLLLVVIGFCIFGPQVLLVGTAPTDLARRGTAAAAAGFVNSAGYLGAFAGDQVTGYLADPRHGFGWPVAICVWAAWSLAAAMAVAFLWHAGARPRAVLPSALAGCKKESP